MNTDDLLRDMTKSSCIDWRTTQPFQMGDVKVERIGFAADVLVYVMCHCKDFQGMVAIARQVVYRALEEAGIPSEILEITCSVCKERDRRKFVDCNEASPTKGKNKFGGLYRLGFRVKNAKFYDYFEWPSYRRGQIPERKTT